MITESNVATKEVYDLQTAYQELGYKLGAWANMENPAILNGRDGKYGDTCIGITKQIQAEYELPQTGNVDFITYGKIVMALIDAKQTQITALNSTIINKDIEIDKLNAEVLSKSTALTAQLE